MRHDAAAEARSCYAQREPFAGRALHLARRLPWSRVDGVGRARWRGTAHVGELIRVRAEVARVRVPAQRPLQPEVAADGVCIAGPPDLPRERPHAVVGHVDHRDLVVVDVRVSPSPARVRDERELPLDPRLPYWEMSSARRHAHRRQEAAASRLLVAGARPHSELELALLPHPRVDIRRYGLPRRPVLLRREILLHPYRRVEAAVELGQCHLPY